MGTSKTSLESNPNPGSLPHLSVQPYEKFTEVHCHTVQTAAGSKDRAAPIAGMLCVFTQKMRTGKMRRYKTAVST
ncbi:MAG: hypothetical protein LBP76_14950 [Treponema sp.]|jgi:hypothetical protein|nr:hypothetical protein [Treponema sp.]